MFGLFYLAWLAVLIALFVFVVRNLIRSFREPELRRRSLTRMFLQVIGLAALTWPFLLGRAVYDLNCKYRSGLRVTQTVDLSDGGYLIWPDGFDERSTTSQPWESLPYDHQGVQDLLMGRIAFFERPISKWLGGASGNQVIYERFRLGNLRGRGCLGGEREEALLMGLRLPAGKCITLSESRTSLARYRLEGQLQGREHYPASIGRANFHREFVDLESGETLASYKMFSHWRGLIADSGAGMSQCPALRETLTHSPLRGLTAFVLRDKQGGTSSLESIRKWRDAKAPGGGSFPGELPPRAVTGQPDADSSSTCRAEPIEGDFGVHKIQTYHGRNLLPVRLDGSNNGVGQLEVVVNNPDQPVVLLLSAHDPVVWHVSRTADSRIAAVLVKGSHGQAVLGLERNVPLFISTRSRGPGTNCYPNEMSTVHRVIIGNRNLKSDTTMQGPFAPRFALVGNEVPDGSQSLYSRDRTLGEFTMELSPPDFPRP